jgi:hypothetical protein
MAFQDSMQLQKSGLPAPLDGTHRDLQDGGGLGLRQFLIEEEADHFLFICWKLLDLLMKFAPVG